MEKFIGGILAISPGLFLGREGPSIQLGAVVGQGYSQWRQSAKSEEKILISSGASAGLAAAFNAPIAGLLFVLEEVHHSFSPLVWLTSFLRPFPLTLFLCISSDCSQFFILVRLNLLPLEYYWTLVLLGVLLGLLGWIYQKHCCPYQKYMEKSKAFLLIIMVLFLLF